MSRKKAIDEKCTDCIYDPLTEGTWRKQVEMCGFSDCPLYPYRPITQRSRAEKSTVSEAKKVHMAKIRVMKGASNG